MSRREVVTEQNSKVKEVAASNEDDGVKIDQIAKIRAWFRPEDQSAFYPIIQEYLDANMDLSEATQKLFNPIDEKISESKLDDVNFWDLWLSIIHSAKRIPFSNADKHAKVVNLVAAFKNHSVQGNEKYNYLFSSLTDFGMACRETMNDSPTGLGKGDVVQQEIDAWANVNFFFARITVKEIMDLSLYAIWAMREALEVVQQDGEGMTGAQKLDVVVPAAAVWVYGMGSSLFNKEKDLTPKNRNEGNPAKGGELWKGKAEFSKERWAFWKERFAQIGKTGNVSEKTSSIARDACQAMERAETFERVRESVNGETAC